jgi:hypothetical protein
LSERTNSLPYDDLVETTSSDWVKKREIPTGVRRFLKEEKNIYF